MAAKKTTAQETTRPQFAWTDEHVEWLLGTPSASTRKERIAAFRERFPKAKVTDQGIAGKYYTLTRRPEAVKPEHAIAGLNVRIAELTEQLRIAKAQLAEAKKAAKATATK